MIRLERLKRQRAEGFAANHNLPPNAGGPPAGIGHPAPATRPAPDGSSQAGSGTAHPVLPEAVLQADTAIRGAANVLTFGGADNLEAAMDALPGGGGFQGWRRRYDANLKEQHNRNDYDAQHRRIAQATGQLGGTALGVGLVGPMEGGLAAVPRLPGAAALTGREAATVLGTGAGVGVGAQTASDLARRRRSSAGDQLGAAVGGMAGAAALPLGPGRAGAVDGFTTSAAQDILNGRPISLERAGQSAIAGNVFGGAAGIGGRTGSNALPPVAKGRLGEAMGDVRGAVNGQFRSRSPKKADYFDRPTSNAYWFPDARIGDLRFEDKFGVQPKLSPNQIRAQNALGPNFHLNSFVPADIGRIAGMMGAAIAPQVVERPRRR